MILVLNCGSQSIKWKVFGDKLQVVKEGSVVVENQNDFEEVLRLQLESIRERASDISVIGHRVVHGGGIFTAPLEITPENLVELEKVNHLAPIHNPFNILGIKACQKIFANAKQIAVFDTEFFKDLPEKAFTYALPENIAKEFSFRKFGFQGTSHEFVARECAKQLKKPFNKLKIITCHLGGGASITAVKNGKAIDTSMGWTPVEGLVMMTRCGDIDAGIVLELIGRFGIDRTNQILNKESGVKGICGQDKMLKVLEMVKQGDESAKLALDVFVYSIQKYIGSYFAILGGCDALVFTGSIGSGSKKIRDMILKNLDILKKTKILVIETNEELAIAQKIIKLK